MVTENMQWALYGNFMTNACKAYKKVPKSRQVKSRFDQTVIWEWPEKIHVVPVFGGAEGQWTLTPEYFQWRYAGMNAKEPIRYPVGHNHRHECICAFEENVDGSIIQVPLDYIQSRKRIYLPLYSKLVSDKPRFAALQNEWRAGTNLLIIEVDGPHQESLPYYQQKYGAPPDWIVHDSIECTRENLQILLNDDKHPFGHGYCLAAVLQGFQLN